MQERDLLRGGSHCGGAQGLLWADRAPAGHALDGDGAAPAKAYGSRFQTMFEAGRVGHRFEAPPGQELFDSIDRLAAAAEAVSAEGTARELLG